MPCPPPRDQIPERSGLPSAVLGGGPSRFGFPSAVFGTPGVGTVDHCAKSANCIAAKITAKFANLRKVFIQSLQRSSNFAENVIIRPETKTRLRCQEHIDMPLWTCGVCYAESLVALVL